MLQTSYLAFLFIWSCWLSISSIHKVPSKYQGWYIAQPILANYKDIFYWYFMVTLSTDKTYSKICGGSRGALGGSVEPPFGSLISMENTDLNKSTLQGIYEPPLEPPFTESWIRPRKYTQMPNRSARVFYHFSAVSCKFRYIFVALVHGCSAQVLRISRCTPQCVILKWFTWPPRCLGISLWAPTTRHFSEKGKKNAHDHSEVECTLRKLSM